MKKQLLSTILIASIFTANSQVINGLVTSYDYNASNQLDAIAPKANGSVSNSTYKTDRFGNEGAAINFTGTSSGHLVGSATKNLFTTGFTISTWVKANNVTNQQAIVSKWINAVNSDQYILMISAGKAFMAVGKSGVSASGYSGNTTLTTNTWYHIVASWDTSGRHEIYINGISDLNIVDPNFKTINSTSATNLSIGSQNNSSRFLDGSVDDVKLYNRKLSSTEITSLYNESNPIVNNLVSKYLFDNQTADDEINNNDGTITNAAWTADRFGNPNKALNVVLSSTRLNLNDSYDGFSTGVTGKISYSFWVNFKSVTSTYQMLLMKYSDSGCSANERQFLLRLNPNNKLDIGGQGTLGPNNGISYEGNTTIVAGQWYHIVLTYDASIGSGSNKFGLFVDNVPETLTNTSTVGVGLGSGYLDGPACIGVGAYLNSTGNICSNVQRLDAYFDDLYIYSKVLNNNEINDLFGGLTPTGISDSNNTSVLSVFPNPFSDNISIRLNTNIKTNYCIFNITGHMMMNEESDSKEYSLNTENLQKGIYFIRITNDNSTITKKIIK